MSQIIRVEMMAENVTTVRESDIRFRFKVIPTYGGIMEFNHRYPIDHFKTVFRYVVEDMIRQVEKELDDTKRLEESRQFINRESR